MAFLIPPQRRNTRSRVICVGVLWLFLWLALVFLWLSVQNLWLPCWGRVAASSLPSRRSSAVFASSACGDGQDQGHGEKIRYGHGDAKPPQAAAVIEGASASTGSERRMWLCT